jgi:hypothetical protein
VAETQRPPGGPVKADKPDKADQADQARAGATAPASDPELEAAFKQVLQIIHKQHPLKANQILVLAAELQRLGVHRLVEEHLRAFGHRLESGSTPPA